MRPLISIIAIGASILCAPSAIAQSAPPSAQSQCLPIAVMMKVALDKYHEKPIVAGKIDDSDAVLVITAAQDGAFSVFRVGKDGTACFIEGGTALSLATPNSAQ